MSRLNVAAFRAALVDFKTARTNTAGYYEDRAAEAYDDDIRAQLSTRAARCWREADLVNGIIAALDAATEES